MWPKRWASQLATQRQILSTYCVVVLRLTQKAYISAYLPPLTQSFRSKSASHRSQLTCAQPLGRKIPGSPQNMHVISDC